MGYFFSSLNKEPSGQTCPRTPPGSKAADVKRQLKLCHKTPGLLWITSWDIHLSSLIILLRKQRTIAGMTTCEHEESCEGDDVTVALWIYLDLSDNGTHEPDQRLNPKRVQNNKYSHIIGVWAEIPTCMSAGGLSGKHVCKHSLVCMCMSVIRLWEKGKCSGWTISGAIMGSVSFAQRSKRVCLCVVIIAYWPLPQGYPSALSHLEGAYATQRLVKNLKMVYHPSSKKVGDYVC